MDPPPKNNSKKLNVLSSYSRSVYPAERERERERASTRSFILPGKVTRAEWNNSFSVDEN